MNLQADIISVLPELFLSVGLMLLLIYGVFKGNDYAQIVHKGAIGVLLLTLAVLLGFNPASETSYFFHDMFVVDSYSLFFKTLILIGSISVLAISFPYLKLNSMAQFEYPVLIMLATLGMFVMVSSSSMLTLYMGIELMSLSLYILAAFRRNNALSSEAGIKYFVLGALSSGLLLFGISLIYGYTGSLTYTGIETALAGGAISQGFIVGMVFVLAALAFKITAAPFHVWAPDVYEGAPTSVTAFFASVPKIAAFALLLRLLFGPFEVVISDWGQVIYFVSLLSMLVGAFAALVQSNIKRLLAFSSVGHVGYALVALTSGLAIGLTATVAYLVIYLVMTLGTFALILSLNAGDKMIETIDDLAGLSKSSPVISYLIAVMMFSMAGIPPMAGFFAKLYVFQAAIEGGAYILAVIGVLSSVVAAYYYLRIIKVIFFDEGDIVLKREKSFGHSIVLTLSTAFVLFYIISPGFLLDIVSGSVAPLLING